jgi:hypothetical protein
MCIIPIDPLPISHKCLPDCIVLACDACIWVHETNNSTQLHASSAAHIYFSVGWRVVSPSINWSKIVCPCYPRKRFTNEIVVICARSYSISLLGGLFAATLALLGYDKIMSRQQRNFWASLRTICWCWQHDYPQLSALHPTTLSWCTSADKVQTF